MANDVPRHDLQLSTAAGEATEDTTDYGMTGLVNGGIKSLRNPVRPDRLALQSVGNGALQSSRSAALAALHALARP